MLIIITQVHTSHKGCITGGYLGVNMDLDKNRESSWREPAHSIWRNSKDHMMFSKFVNKPNYSQMNYAYDGLSVRRNE